MGHEKPDGDCIGSQLACAGLLKKLNKKVHILSSGPFSDAVSQLYRAFFPMYPPSEDVVRAHKGDAAVICVDTSSPSRLGHFFLPLKDLPLAVIDHHAEGESYGEVKYIDQTASSNTLLIYRLFKEYRIVPTKEDAYFILLGLLTDTQFFRFVSAKNTEPFEVAAKMVRLGVSPREIYRQIEFGYTFLSRKILATILNRATRVNNNRIVLTHIRHGDYMYKDDIPQSYEVYQILQGVQKIEIVVYIHEDVRDDGSVVCKIGLRSQRIVDVAKIARSFNGGGHTKASGFMIAKPLSEVWDFLKKYFDELSI